MLDFLTCGILQYALKVFPIISQSQFAHPFGNPGSHQCGLILIEANAAGVVYEGS